MNKLLSGSICLTDLIAYAKEQHSAFIKANNGKIYINLSIWLNSEPDKFDNDASIQLNSKKGSEDKKHYVGNAHYVTPPETVTAADVENLGDDLPW